MDLFNLVARITLDSSGYKKQLGEAEKETSSFGSKVKSGLKATAGVIGAGITAAGAAVVALGKKSIDAYANYEQLVGGVETLFKDSAGIVQEYAANAYKTAGLSANQYMETVTSFSASLLQSLDGDTKKAANMADVAITDMADNANKMGTSMESIQNAYQGFAKQNYTMLDNLKLGYGGTAKEMYRLMEDAAKLDKKFAETADFSLDEKGHLEAGYADIVEAIHIVQKEMGITGTTAQEAEHTIQGSIASTKAAWQNLITGLTDENADLEQLTNNFFETAGKAAENLIPRISNVFSGISVMLEKLAPKLAAEVPKILDSLLPGLISGSVGLIDSLVTSLPKIISPLLSAVPQLLSGIEQIFYSLTAALPDLIQIILTALPTLVPQLITSAVNLIVFLAEHISEIVHPIILALPSIIETIGAALWSNLPQLLTACVDIVVFLVGEIVNLIGGFLKNFYGPIFEWLDNLFRDAWTAISGFFSDIWDAVSNAFGKAAKWVYDTIINPVADFFKELWEKIVSTFHMVIDPWVEIFKRAAKKYIYDPIIKPVLEFFKKLWDDIVAIWEKVSGWFSEHVIEPVRNLFADIWNSVKEKAAEAWEGIKETFQPVADWFHNVFSNAWQKVKDVFSTGGKVFDGIKDGIVSTFKTVVNAIIGGINKVIVVPFEAINNILQKIHDVEILGVSPFTYIHTIDIPEMPLLAKGGIVDRPVIAGEDGAEAIIPLERNTEWIQNVAKQIEQSSSNGENVRILQMMLDEMHALRRDMYGIILTALRTNSDELDGSERDLIRLVKKYAFA